MPPGARQMSEEPQPTTITRELFRARVNSHALWGTGIALFAVIAGTLLVAVYQFGTLSPEALIAVQTQNPALWLLNVMPFVFGIWGQLTGAMIMSRAGEMVMDRTRTLSSRTLQLEEALRQSSNNRYQIRGLKTADAFGETLAQDIRERGGCYDGIGVVALDFNQLRDVRGLAGDKALPALLDAIAERLERTLRDSDMMAHVQDDQFIVALYDVGASGNYLPRVCRRLYRALNAPLTVAEQSFSLMPCMGAVLYPRDGGDARELMKLADQARQATAMSESSGIVAKNAQPANVPELSRAFSRALDGGELQMEYTPQVGATDGLLVYLRARAGWHEAEYDNPGGDELAEIAGRSGRLHDYLLWLCDESLRSLRFWREHQDLMVGLALPIPAAAAARLALTDILDGLLAKYRIPPASVVLEFSGQSLAATGAAGETGLTELRERGYRIALSGYGGRDAAMQDLLHYRPDEVRLTEALGDEAVHDPAVMDMTGDLAKLATRLGATVVLPGVCDMKKLSPLIAQARVHRLEGPAVADPMRADRVGYWQQFGPRRRAGMLG